MKRKNTKATPVVHNHRITSLDKQRTFYAKQKQQRVFNAIKAANTLATVYTPLNTGAECPCRREVSMLTPEGDLTDIGYAAVVDATRRTFSASDFDADGVDPVYFDADNIAEPDEILDLDAFGQTRCGICFGNGYLGGYALSSGSRHVIPVDDMIHDGKVDSQNPPRLSDATFIEFTLTLPSRYQNNPLYRLWNDDTPSTNHTTLNLVFGVPNTYRLGVSETLTHLEIQHGVNAYVDFPQLANDFNPSLLGETLETTLSVTGNIPQKFGVILEQRFNRHWHIKSVTPHYDQGNVLFWDAEVRLIAHHELFTRLAR